MRTLTGWIDFWNGKVKQMTIWDVKLAQTWTAAWILVLVKLFPQIMELSIWWFVGVILLCVPWIVYCIFLRKSKGTTDP